MWLIARSKNLSGRKHFPVECDQSYAQLNNSPVRAALFQTKRRVRRLFAHFVALAQGYIQELHNFRHRIVLRSSKQYRAMPLRVGPACHLGQTGLPEECIRTRDCIRDIEHFAAFHPRATVIDWGHFREGWEAGEKWNRNNQCSCTSASSTS